MLDQLFGGFIRGPEVGQSPGNLDGHLQLLLLLQLRPEEPDIFLPFGQNPSEDFAFAENPFVLVSDLGEVVRDHVVAKSPGVVGERFADAYNKSSVSLETRKPISSPKCGYRVLFV